MLKPEIRQEFALTSDTFGFKWVWVYEPVVTLWQNLNILGLSRRQAYGLSVSMIGSRLYGYVTYFQSCSQLTYTSDCTNTGENPIDNSINYALGEYGKYNFSVDDTYFACSLVRLAPVALSGGFSQASSLKSLVNLKRKIVTKEVLCS